MAENIDSLSIQSVNRFILAKQHLSEDSKIDDIVQITKDIGGLHATSATTRTFLFSPAQIHLLKKISRKNSIKKKVWPR